MPKPVRAAPIRTCVACRTPGDKRGLLRVVRLPDEGGVVFDASGKANGRGAYVCASEACIRAAAKKRQLNRSLKTEVPESLFEALLERAITSP